MNEPNLRAKPKAGVQCIAVANYELSGLHLAVAETPPANETLRPLASWSDFRVDFVFDCRMNRLPIKTSAMPNTVVGPIINPSNNTERISATTGNITIE